MPHASVVPKQIKWELSMQSTIMTSTLAAEMRALFQLIQEIIFVIGLCKKLVRPLHLPGDSGSDAA